MRHDRVHGILCTLLILHIVLFMSSLQVRAAMSEKEPLNLFQNVARADLIVHVRVRDGALRYAVVQVLGVLKGDAPDSTLRIAFRDFNFDRPTGTDPIVFPDGQEELLFLTPDMAVRRNEKNRDLYQLYGGADGRFTVPAEGSGILLQAIGRLVSVAALDPARQLDQLRELIDNQSLYLSEASLDELERLRAATPELYPRLVALLSRPAPALRLRATRLLRSLFAAAAGGEEDGDVSVLPDQPRTALAALLALARTDPEVEVRVAAVSAAAAWPHPQDIAADLRSIAERDADQAVRYEAKRAIFRLGLR
jgi:hypothetical protein